jgi:hypothetical protein
MRGRLDGEIGHEHTAIAAAAPRMRIRFGAKGSFSSLETPRLRLVLEAECISGVD